MAGFCLRAALMTVLFTVLLCACSTQPPAHRVARYTPHELLDGEAFGIRSTILPAVDLLAVNDDMRAFLREHVPEDVSDVAKVRGILEAIIGSGLQLRYDNFKTYTAEEAFYAQSGNCLSFTNLFVALAREAGVDARYQAVEVPPIWSAQRGIWRLNLHINALVDLPGAKRVVDFDMASFSEEMVRRVISDELALAHYYNNMGVFALSELDLPLALAYLREAIHLAPRASYLWANLGSLYRRTKHWDAAEAAYLRAIELDQDPVAYSNLARLYEAQGEDELAAYYHKRTDIFRASNPYYLFHLARKAYAAHDFDEAQYWVRKAIIRNPTDHAFFQLQGLARVQLGDVDGARKSFSRAAALAEGDARARYNHKLELLAATH